MTSFTRLLVFIHHHIQDVLMTAESVPTGKVLLPRSHLLYVTAMAPLMTLLIRQQAVNFFPVSLTDHRLHYLIRELQHV